MYLDWEKQAHNTYVIDIETDDLDATKIWVMCYENLKTGEKGALTNDKDIRRWFEERPDGIFVGHNILKFDGPALSRLLGVQLSVKNCIDTLVLSTLYSPSISGGHSLDAWGQRLGVHKQEFSDWSGLTDAMIEYCHQDVTVTVNLFRKLVQTLSNIGFSELSIWIQHRSTVILERQRKNGFYFDGKRALTLYQELRDKGSGLEDEIRKAFPATPSLVATRNMYTKDGRYTSIYVKDCERYSIVESSDGSGTYQAFEDVEFNLGSPKQRVEKLLELGWEPEEFTEKGTPQPFKGGEVSDSLARFLEEHDVPEVKLIAQWMTVNGRANMINTWLDNWNEDTGCIHGKLFVADTLRFRHQAPNTANIPAVRTTKQGSILYAEEGYYTYEARDLWTARPGRVLVGTDASGLELRMLAHYLGRPDFTKQVVEGDPHQYNADTVGVTRPQAKTLIYAIMYGAGPPKIARTLGVLVKEGARIRNMFLEKLGLKELIEECQYEQKTGRVSLCDGSQVVCPSPHAALNYKLQGSGARCMSYGSFNLEVSIGRMGLDSLKVGDIHDEWQYDVHPDNAETHATASVQAIRDVGEQLNLNVPLDGEAKIGKTWAETH